MERDTPSTSRQKRQKVDKSGRFIALQKLKQLKGSKHKYEVEDIENVYDEVDEDEYMKTISERQNSDWIIDDGRSGYIEDGREIFDDDLDDMSIQKASRKNSNAPRKRKRDGDNNDTSGTIMNMLKHASTKKKCEDVHNGDDELLANMLATIKSNKACPSTQLPIQSNKFQVMPKPHAQSSDIFSATLHKSETSSADKFMIFDMPHPSKTCESSNDIHVENNLKMQYRTPKIEGDDVNLQRIELQTNEKCMKSKKIDGCHNPVLDNADEDFDIEIFSTSNITSTTNATSSTTAICTNSAIDVNDRVTVNNCIQKSSFTKIPVIEDDDFDAIIGSIDEENLCRITDKSAEKASDRPIINDQNFEEVIASLDKKAPWSSLEKNLTHSSISNGETIQSISNNIDLSSCIMTNDSGDSVIRFFWWDAVENPYRAPGVVNLLGKIYLETTKQYISCCLSIKNIPRRIYLLPKEKVKDGNDERPITMTDVYNEFNQLAKKNNISEFRSAVVTKSYAFDRAATPLKSEYLEVKYSSNAPMIDSSYTGSAIEHIFGTSVNPLELLLMERDMRGPSWLEIKSPKQVIGSVSWCPLQVNCLKMENVSVYKDDSKKLAIPPMKIATITVRTTLNSKTNDTEIVMIGMLINDNYHVDKPSPKTKFQQHYCFLTHPNDTQWPLYARDQLSNSKTMIIVCESESDLLAEFLNTIHQVDPDLLAGYDCGFQFDIIYRRLMYLRVNNWSKIGKLKQNTIVSSSRVSLSGIFGGRPICDLLTSVKELNVKIRSYDLDSICHAVLKTDANTIREIKPVDCPQFYASVDKIKTLIKVTMSEALYIATLMYELNVIPLALQITCIAGNIMSRTLSAGRAERNEYLLLHAFSKRGYITPDKPMKNNSNIRNMKKKAAYAGGLVLEPERGFYDKLILLMDFNSLYPSIIQEYNLCFTTIPGVCYNNENELKLPQKDIEIGVVPIEIRRLVESRREVKNLMQRQNLSAELKMQYNIRQLALKLTANSMYGCLGATHCRFYAKGLAALVTAKGREILTHTKTLVESLNYRVIYGDTDSLMINSNTLNYEQAFDIAKAIKLEVNRRYKTLELDIDGVFRYLLLLQKKKYAAVLMRKSPDNVKYEYITEYKGLDIVRRDWCHLACEMGRTILDQIFIDASDEEKLSRIKEKLHTVSMAIRNNQLPLTSFIVTKQLSKNPNEYPDRKQPHVAVAMRLNKMGGRMWKAGDTISYVICIDGTDRNAPERAYHMDEFKKRDDLKIDSNYYLLSQIFPVINRICEPVGIITDLYLADCLGLTNIYKQKISKVIDKNHQMMTNTTTHLMADDDSYKTCEPFKFDCSMCNSPIEISGFFVNNESSVKKPSLLMCSNQQCNFPPYKNLTILQNTLQLNLRSITKKYYQQKFVCTNIKCGKQQRGVILSGWRGIPQCRKCKIGYLTKPYKDSQCWHQLNFYRYIFDMSQNTNTIADEIYPSEMLLVYDQLKEEIETYLKRDRFALLDFASIYTMISMGYSKKGMTKTNNKFINRPNNCDIFRKSEHCNRVVNYIGRSNLGKWHEMLMKKGSIKVDSWSIG